MEAAEASAQRSDSPSGNASSLSTSPVGVKLSILLAAAHLDARTALALAQTDREHRSLALDERLWVLILRSKYQLDVGQASGQVRPHATDRETLPSSRRPLTQQACSSDAVPPVL